MSSGATAQVWRVQLQLDTIDLYNWQDKVWKTKEQGDEAQYARSKVYINSYRSATHPEYDQPQEQEQLAALREKIDTETKAKPQDFEGGFGGQEDLEDRYATTSGEH